MSDLLDFEKAAAPYPRGYLDHIEKRFPTLAANLNTQAQALVDAARQEERELTERWRQTYDQEHSLLVQRERELVAYAPLLAAATEYASAARAASLVEAHHGAPEGQRLWAATEKLYLAALALPLPEAPNE